MVPAHSPRTQRLGVHFCSQSFSASCWGNHFIGKRTRRSIERAPAGTPSGDADAPGGWLPSLNFNVRRNRLAMRDAPQPIREFVLVIARVLMAACLTLSIAILWGEARRQLIQGVMHGIPLAAALVTSVTLFLVSLLTLRWHRRLGVYGLLTSFVGLLVCSLPTL
jgi:hypothetical protein